VRWPTGIVEKFDGVEADGIRTIKEGIGATVGPEAKKPR
jgi:hypothetical protein